MQSQVIHGSVADGCLQIDMLGLFNRVRFGYPGTAPGNPQFGVISGQFNDPRLVQLAATRVVPEALNCQLTLCAAMAYFAAQSPPFRLALPRGTFARQRLGSLTAVC